MIVYGYYRRILGGSVYSMPANLFRPVEINWLEGGSISDGVTIKTVRQATAEVSIQMQSKGIWRDDYQW